MAGFQRKNGKLGLKHRPTCPALYSMKATHVLIQDGNFACYNLRTGKECWRSEKQFGSGRHGKYMSLIGQEIGFWLWIKAAFLNQSRSKIQLIDSKKFPHSRLGLTSP